MRISDWSSDVCSSDLQQIDARLVVHAGIEEQVAGHQRRRLLPLHVESDAAIAAPVIGNGAAAVRNDEPELGKPLEEVGAQQLHEGGGIRIDVVRAGEMEVRIAGVADMEDRKSTRLNSSH